MLGDPADATTDIQSTLALAGDTALSDEWVVFAEATGFLQDEETSATSRFGAAFRPRPDLTIDFAFGIGLEDAPPFQFFVGFTQNLGPLFRRNEGPN